MANWNFLEGDFDDDSTAIEERFGRDCIICAVDCSEPMFIVKSEDGLTHFEMSLKVILNIYNRKCVTNDRDYVGLLLYNTAQLKNSHNFESVYILHELAFLNAEKVKEIEKLLSGNVRENFREKFGHNDCKMDEMFWSCATMFSDCGIRQGTRRIMLFTNCDYPHRNEIDRQKRVQQKIQDLKEQGVQIEVLPVGRDFTWENFYLSALFDDDKNAMPSPADRLEELLERAIRKQFKKRSMATLPFELAPGVEIACSLFNMVTPARVPIPVKLDRKTNDEIKTVKTYTNVETGERLLPIDLKKCQSYGGAKISMEVDEVEQLRKLFPPGIVLIGFQRKSALKSFYHIRQGFFMYPEEQKVKGSTALFRCLLERCATKDVVAIGRLTARTNMAPRLVALVPQLEELDVKGFQEQAAGFHVIFLPFADDVRDLSKKLALGDYPAADLGQIGRAKSFIEKIIIDYNPDTIANPVLQTHYKAVEAFALEREDVEPVPDHTKPNIDWILRKAGHAIQEFSKSIYPDDYVPGLAASKRKAQSDLNSSQKKVKTDLLSLEDEAKAGKLNKLTVPILKEMCATLGIKLTATRKADIIDQINLHFDV